MTAPCNTSECPHSSFLPSLFPAPPLSLSLSLALPCALSVCLSALPRPAVSTPTRANPRIDTDPSEPEDRHRPRASTDPSKHRGRREQTDNTTPDQTNHQPERTTPRQQSSPGPTAGQRMSASTSPSTTTAPEEAAAPHDSTPSIHIQTCPVACKHPWLPAPVGAVLWCPVSSVLCVLWCGVCFSVCFFLKFKRWGVK